MMTVSVCVGSSCHLRGSYKIIELMTEAIKKNNLEDKVKLSAAFCLGQCEKGVTIKVDDEIVCGVNSDNFKEIFDKYVLQRV